MATTPILAIAEVATNQTQKEVTINNMVVALEAAANDVLSFTFTANARTLTTAELTRYACFTASNQTASATLTVPLSKRSFLVWNAHGTEDIVVGGATGATVTVGSSTILHVFCDGTDCTVIGASAAPGSAITAVHGTLGAAATTTLGVATVSLDTIGAGQVLANTGTATAAPAGVSVSDLLDAGLASTQGDILYRGATAWAALPPGTSGQFLSTGGAAADPSWQNSVSAWNAGTVSTLGPNLGLTTGTLDIVNSPTFSGTVTAAAFAGPVLLTSLPTSVSNTPIGFVLPGAQAASATFNIPLATGLVIPANLAGTVVYDVTQATANAAFVLNSITGGTTITPIGTITITPASHVSATLSVQAATTMAAGDILQLVAPATPDLTLADVGISILAQKV